MATIRLALRRRANLTGPHPRPLRTRAAAVSTGSSSSLRMCKTGFGSFVAVYLTAQKWTEVDIGLVLTIGSLVGLAGQIPGGAIVDAARSTRRAAALAVMALGASAFALAAWPIFIVVLGSRIAQAGASCVLGPAMAAISLGLVGRDAIGERLGRNASFASVGTGLAAAGMGASGYYLSNRAVFFVAAVMVVPALIALFQIESSEIDSARAHGDTSRSHRSNIAWGLGSLLADSSLRIFAVFSSPMRPCCPWRQAW